MKKTIILFCFLFSAFSCLFAAEKDTIVLKSHENVTIRNAKTYKVCDTTLVTNVTAIKCNATTKKCDTVITRNPETGEYDTIKCDTVLIKCNSDICDTFTVKCGETIFPEQTYYPSWVKFPSVDTHYNKVIACLTFQCPDQGNCSAWDYINYIRIGKIGGVNGKKLNWEIGRFITPYNPTAYNSQIKSTWKHAWYYDMTDFAPLLHDSAEIIYVHTGYEDQTRGWKMNLTFYIIPGTPPLEAHKVTPLWTKSYKYGDNIADSLKIKPITVTLDDATKTANVKIIQTGHGNDKNTECCEFCKKKRWIKFDGNTIDERYLWRECGFNPVFPQGGTWIYDRGNWCPGAEVQPSDSYVQNLTGGTSHSVDLVMESSQYTDQGNWTITSYLVEYGVPKYKTDVSCEEIVAPSKDYPYLRVNPICGSPVVVIKNNGTETLQSLDIAYGVKGGNLKTKKWEGSLKFLEYDTLYLDSDIDWKTGDGSRTFEVNLQNPNAKTDEFSANNTAYSPYNLVDTLPANFQIRLKTNTYPSQNYYYLVNLTTGDTVLNKKGFSANLIYFEEAKLNRGCYRLELYDDGESLFPFNKNGLDFWAHRSHEGTGAFSLMNAKKTATLKTFNPDFGTKILYQFRVETDDVGINDVKESSFLFNVSPNPANEKVTIVYDYKKDVSNGTITITDVMGKTIKNINLSQPSGSTTVDVSNFAKGSYFFTLNCSEGSITRKQIVQ